MNAIETIDYHTAGEPFRIVAEPPVPIPGHTIAQRRAEACAGSEVDDLRRLLCFEPRGHADMYGGFIVPPDDDGAHFGVLFWHKDGFSTACGHGTIALGAWALDSGRVATDGDGPTDVVIDVPSGRVVARVHTAADGHVTEVDFVSVPSAVVASGIEVATSSGPCGIDLAWGGALYACVDAASVGLTVSPEHLTSLISLGREVKAALAGDPRTEHPTDARLSGVYGTIIFDELGTLPTGELHQRNVTIFADGQVDRSPCGSGTAARLAVLHATGELADGQALVHDSIVGSRFRATVHQAFEASTPAAIDMPGEVAGEVPGDVPGDVPGNMSVTGHGGPAVAAVVTGSAHRVASSRFEVDPHDPLVPGFVLR